MPAPVHALPGVPALALRDHSRSAFQGHGAVEPPVGLAVRYPGPAGAAVLSCFPPSLIVLLVDLHAYGFEWRDDVVGGDDVRVADVDRLGVGVVDGVDHPDDLGV